MTDETIIDVRGLRTQFGDHVVHENLDLKVRKGEVLGIVGGSGTGKSVLLRTIVGLNRPAAGHINVLGEEPSELNEEARQALEQRWGILFQDGALFSALTVAENVQVAYREHLHMPEEMMDELAALKVRLVGLPIDAASKYPSELSGGMRKRAGLPARWRLIRKFFSSMSRRQGSIPSGRRLRPAFERVAAGAGAYRFPRHP